MNEIGETFKEKREEIGITTGEVANDLKIDPILVENLESGNHKVFKDILELKDTISSYAKYLGLNDEELLDKLNDYLFETTSKISIEDIKERLKKEEETKEEKKVKTPYTLETTKKKSLTTVVILLLVLVILVVFYIVLKRVFL